MTGRGVRFQPAEESESDRQRSLSPTGKGVQVRPAEESESDRQRSPSPTGRGVRVRPAKSDWQRSLTSKGVRPAKESDQQRSPSSTGRGVRVRPAEESESDWQRSPRCTGKGVQPVEESKLPNFIQHLLLSSHHVDFFPNYTAISRKKNCCFPSKYLHTF